MRRALDGLLSITLPSLSVAAENADRGSRERRELWPDRSDLSEKKKKPKHLVAAQCPTRD